MTAVNTIGTEAHICIMGKNKVVQSIAILRIDGNIRLYYLALGDTLYNEGRKTFWDKKVWEGVSCYMAIFIRLWNRGTDRKQCPMGQPWHSYCSRLLMVLTYKHNEPL